MDAFTSESIDSILERCTTTRTDGTEGGGDNGATAKGKGAFAQAAFVAQDGTEARLDMDDPNFWTKVLGEETVVPEEVDEMGANVFYDDEGALADPRLDPPRGFAPHAVRLQSRALPPETRRALIAPRRTPYATPPVRVRQRLAPPLAAQLD